MLDEGADAPFVFEYVFFGRALIGQFNAHTLIEECQLPQAFGQDVIMKFDVSEYQRAGLETNGCAGGAAITDFSQRRYRITQSIGLIKHLAVPVDGQLQFFRERIHYGYAHAMKPTRDFVGIAVELTTGVEYGHNDLSGRPSLLGVNVHRDAPPVV